MSLGCIRGPRRRAARIRGPLRRAARTRAHGAERCSHQALWHPALVPQGRSTTRRGDTRRVGLRRLGSSRAWRLGPLRLGSRRLGSWRFGARRFGTRRFGPWRFGARRLGTRRFGRGFASEGLAAVIQANPMVRGRWPEVEAVECIDELCESRPSHAGQASALQPRDHALVCPGEALQVALRQPKSLASPPDRGADQQPAAADAGGRSRLIEGVPWHLGAGIPPSHQPQLNRGFVRVPMGFRSALAAANRGEICSRVASRTRGWLRQLRGLDAVRGSVGRMELVSR